MKHALSDLASRMGGQLVGEDAVVTGFATDSNSVQPGDLFLAIQGARVDGHEFARSAMEKGAVAVVATRAIPEPHILVDDLPQALARMASWFRAEFEGPVVGITGSAGKTTTKEFVAAALSPLGKVLKTEGNRNTEFTAPLLWAELTPEHEAVVVELGMRGFGQIAHLAQFSRPNIGLITNIGHSHMELVGSRSGIAKAKGELLESLPSDGVAILPHGDDYFGYLKGIAPNSMSFGLLTGEADCDLVGYRQEGWLGGTAVGHINYEVWTAELPAAGRHLALNAAAALLCAYVADVTVDEATYALAQVKLPPMRMEVREQDGYTVLLDAYNAAPGSMEAAIEVLASGPVTGKRRAVIGEMRELGDYSEEAHRALGRKMAAGGIEEAIFVGEATKATIASSGKPGYRFAANMDEVRAFVKASQPGDAILIKGSRAYALEQALD